ncbi:CGNR zinc finger domain-containing protein [Amycolatopsis sp.]|uniref:CGNR zinc finger domain-containing protein n=1 Tax=Amycolatopsis sp. TaxID=37632 RepID=UPI002D803AA9|nr:CGNR zinc finger domain-containing protein [Amycolatopsis sp.]HET6711913.1 CGNR zinc finger domain-containing protein [Amycolatopsis sp.]
MITTAPGEDRAPALALVNTRRVAADDLATPALAASWLSSHGLTAAVADAAALSRLTDLRAAVRELLAALAEGGAPKATAVETVNASARADGAALALTWHDGPSSAWHSTRPGSLDAAVAALARNAIEVVSGEFGPLIRPCEAHGCIRYFLREHARRRWCSTTCGDRVRAARHQRLVVEQREGSR